MRDIYHILEIALKNQQNISRRNLDYNGVGKRTLIIDPIPQSYLPDGYGEQNGIYLR